MPRLSSRLTALTFANSCFTVGCCGSAKLMMRNVCPFADCRCAAGLSETNAAVPAAVTTWQFPKRDSGLRQNRGSADVSHVDQSDSVPAARFRVEVISPIVLRLNKMRHRSGGQRQVSNYFDPVLRRISFCLALCAAVQKAIEASKAVAQTAMSENRRESITLLC